MAFLLATTNKNFSASMVHGVLRLETHDGQLVAIVNSYASIDAYDAGMLNWQDAHALPVQTIAAVAGNPQEWLISPEGPFAGATALVETTPLERLQSLKWAQVKATRDRLETGGFAYLGKTIDSDSRSVQRIALAVQAAQAAMAAGEPFSLEWTCADNSVLALDGAGMVGMPVALALHANTLHEVARGLRELIYAEDATDASVALVVWPHTDGGGV